MASRKFRRNYGQFSADLSDIADLTERRARAIVGASLQDVVINANQATAKGGRMRVDTGFLRASGRASLTGMPSGPTRGEKKDPNAYDDGDAPPHASVTTAFTDLELGATFYYGWTAAYAAVREVYDGFLEGALQQWGRIVAFNTDLMRERIKK